MYTIVESGTKGIEPIKSYEDLEKHHPSKKKERNREYDEADGHLEEIRTDQPGKRRLVKKDFILLVNGSNKSIEVPCPISGYVKTFKSFGTVKIYSSERYDDLIGQVLHLDTNFKVKDGQYVEYGQPLGIQYKTDGEGKPTYAIHTHAELELEQFKKYITDIVSGAIKPGERPAASSKVDELKFQFPIRKPDGSLFSNAEELFEELQKETSGHYLLGSHGFWHGGIHISDLSAPQCKLHEPVRCIADGEVIAYRLNNDYVASTFQGKTECSNLQYSTSFCLVRHHYESPKNSTEGPNKGKQNQLTFYSLYMHLLPHARYPVELDASKSRVKVINGGWPARNLPLGEAGSETLGMLSAGTELEIQEERDSTDHQYHFACGLILKGRVGTKKPGDCVWFATQQNGAPIKNSAGMERLQNLPALERQQPGYWQGQVKATVSAPGGLKIREAPNGDHMGAQLGPNQVLCTTSVIEFDSQQQRLLKLDDGKTVRMAECRLLSGGLKGAGTVPATFWACVEDGGPNKVITRQTITPTKFNSIVLGSTGIKAGDPIGYLGLYETPASIDGGKNSKYQVHLEVFSSDAKLDDFLNNTAGLTEGKQYLRIAKAQQLSSKGGTDAAPTFTPTGSPLGEDCVIELSKTSQLKDASGKDWLGVSVPNGTTSFSGFIAKDKTETISQHNWAKLGFKIIKEQNENSDGFLDPEQMPPFFDALCKEIDHLGNNDGQVAPAELTTALRNPVLRDRWSRLIAYHPTEWQATSDQPKWQRLKELLKDTPALLAHEQERIDKLVFWDEMAGAIQVDLPKQIYHFHPLAFIENIRETTIISAIGNFNEVDAKAALRIIYDKYGKDMAVIIECMYRDETTHFKSKQYVKCGTGGMEAFGQPPYYGWDSTFFSQNPEFTPTGLWAAFENKGMSDQGGNKQITDKKKNFIVFPSVLGGMEYKVFYINKHNGNWARWHSTNETIQATYKKHLENIKARFVNEFEANKK